MSETPATPFDACAAIANWTNGRVFYLDDDTQRIVCGTLVRSKDTFRAIVDRLVTDELVPQAAMLCRSLFEDMVVTHWLVANRPEEQFLVDRFHDHLDAMRLNEARAKHGLGWIDAPDIFDLRGKGERLIRDFGTHAERDWWGIDQNGERINMPALVRRLEGVERFGPRMKGEEPILQQMYSTVQKWNTQLLHHTAFGIPLWIPRDGSLPHEVAPPDVHAIYVQAFWTFAQIVYVTIDVAGLDAYLESFEAVFRPALEGGFASAPRRPGR